MSLKRFLSVILALSMVISCMGITVFAEESVTETTNVAKIGTTEYATLQQAFDAAKDGDTITVLTNITIDESTCYELNGWYEGIYYSGDKSFTVDLGGYTITQDNKKVNDYLILLNNNGEKASTITFKNGTIDAGTTAYCALCTAKSNAQTITLNLEDVALIGNNSNGAVVKVRGGTLLNVNDGTTITGKDNYVGIEAVGSATVVNINDGVKIYQNGTTSTLGALAGVSGGATLNVNGGSGESALCGFIAMTSGGTINANGGEWTALSTSKSQGVISAQNDKTTYPSGVDSIINVTNGVFNGYVSAWTLGNANEVAKVNITGGTFSVDPAAYIADGYKTIENADGTYSVAAITVAKIGDTPYATLQEAINAATDGDIITIINGTTTSSSTTIAKNVTIEGNGKTLTYTGSDRAIEMPNVTDSDYNVTIKNLTVNFSGYSNRGINYNDNGTLTLENVTVNGTQTTYALNFPGKSDGATVIIKDSSITGVIALNVWGENMTITATDSHFTSIDNSAEEKYDAVKLNNDGSISAEGSVITITGGSITALNEEGEPSYATNNATSTGQIIVSATTKVVGYIYDAVAVIRYAGQNEFYSAQTLQNAFDLANKTNAEKVVLIRDIELDETVTVGEGYNIVLDLNGHTITNAATSTITIDGGKLTLKDSKEDGAVIAENTTGASDDKAAILFTANGGTFVLESGTIKSNYYGIRSRQSEDTEIVIEGGTIEAETYGIIDSYGSVTMNGGEINSGCWGIAAYGTFTMNGGKIVALIGYTSHGDYDGTVAIINDGTIETTVYVGIYWPSAGSLTINGGSVTGPNAVYVKSGSVAITGGTFVANAEKVDYYYVASGFVETGDALAIENVGNDGYQAITSVSVTGGTFTSTNASAIASYAATSAVPTATAVDNFIAGGTFNTDVTAYVADGYTLSENADGTYGVEENWITATDAGTYGNNLGMMRWLFALTVDGEVTASGIKYIKSANIGAEIESNVADEVSGTSKAFYGDITGIPADATGTYYAVAYVKIGDKTYWSKPIANTPDFERIFTGYTEGVTNND